MSDIKIKVLHELSSGSVGGTETLCLNYAEHSKHNNSFLILWHPGKISDELIKNHYEVDIFNTKPSKYFKDCIKFIEKCKKEKINVLVCQFCNILTAFSVMMLHYIKPDMKVIGYVHSNPIDWNRKKIIWRKIIYHYSDSIICISDDILNIMKEQFKYDKKLVRIYNGVDTKRFVQKKSMINKKDTLNIIYVGRLEKVKGVHNILLKLSMLKEKIKFTFNIVGDGQYKTDLEKLTEQLKISDKVKFLGTSRDIPQLLLRSDIFIHLPEWQEGFGLTVVEAMATGLTCIVNDHGAMPEIVQDGINGFVIGTSTGRNFNETLSFIYEQYLKGDADGIISRIQVNARKRAQEFSIEEYSKKIDQLISDVSNC